jgi:hypothetical protein
MAAFFQPDGPSALTWFYQTPTGKPPSSPAVLYLGSPQVLARACTKTPSLPTLPDP